MRAEAILRIFRAQLSESRPWAFMWLRITSNRGRSRPSNTSFTHSFCRGIFLDLGWWYWGILWLGMVWISSPEEVESRQKNNCSGFAHVVLDMELRFEHCFFCNHHLFINCKLIGQIFQLTNCHDGCKSVWFRSPSDKFREVTRHFLTGTSHR